MNKILLVFICLAFLGCAQKAGKLANSWRGSEIIYKKSHLNLIDKDAKFYENSCEKGSAFDCYLGGGAYFIGKFQKKDFKKALKLNLKGCELKNALACNNYAGMTEMGFGVDKNPKIAKEFYKISCDLGEILGCINYQALYKN